MKARILEHIKTLEEERNIKVLLACETGSRAWGFPSPDSDYDVRMIYMHPKDWYISLQPRRDHIDLMLDDRMVDISGWDIRKSFNLLYRSNAALLERLQSSEIYCADEKFLQEMRALADDFYAPIAVMYHFLSLTKKMMEDLSDEKVKLKKLFYALRSALVCKWVLDREERPPISIFELMDGLEISAIIRAKIEALIAVKIEANEDYLHPKDQNIQDFINGIILSAEQNANRLNGARNKTQKLNEVFLNWVNNFELIS